jgi:predicted nucleic acid-binding protein
MVSALLDTTVVIDILRGYVPAITWMQAQGEITLGVSSIVGMEIIAGAPDKSAQQKALKLLQQFELIYLTQADQAWAISQQPIYKLSHGTGINDCLIAFISHRLRLPLYTSNLKHLAPLMRWLNSPIDRLLLVG